MTEEQLREISQKKLELIKNNVDNLKTYIDKLSEFRKDQYEIKQVEWTEKLKGIQKVVDDKNYFLFIGKFSAGKSSFINALLGKNLLPTASHPCTAVVTEVSFVDGMPKRVGKIVYPSGEPIVKDRAELMDIIQGKVQFETGAIHHIEIEVDINEFGDNKDSFASFVDKIVLVDCPGFDSPYKFSEHILYEYIEKASFTFYLMPANDFGGYNEVQRLTKLRQKTTTLIPLISKSDLIEDEEEKEDIAGRFQTILSGHFNNQEALFVSTYKYNEYVEKNKALNEKRMLNQVTVEENAEVNNLFVASGINGVFREMAKNSAESELNARRLDQILFNFNDLVDELRKSAINECNYWKKELDKIGFDIECQNYKDIESFDSAMDEYIKDQSESVGKELKDSIGVGIYSVLNSKGGRPGESEIKAVFSDEFKKVTEKYNPVWEKHFNKFFKDLSEKMYIENPDFKAPTINFGLPGGYIPAGILEGISKGGAESIFLSIAGFSLIGAESAIAGITLVGSILAPIAVFGGIALLGYVGIKNINPIKDAIADKKTKNEREFQNKIAEILGNDTKLNFKDVIAKTLTEYKETIKSAVFNKRADDTKVKESNYSECKKFMDKLGTIQNNMNQMK